MTHGISEKQWLRYIDGQLDGPGRLRIDEHILNCSECAACSARLLAWREFLAAEALQLRARVAADPVRLDALLAACLDRVSGPHGWSLAEGAMLMLSLLEPICGLGVARRMRDLAMRQSGGNWQLFVATLSDAIGALCGSTVGVLVSRAGQSIPVGEY